MLNEGDVEGIKKPVLFLYSANDKQISDEFREKIQGILKTKSFPTDGVYYPDQASLQVSERTSVLLSERCLRHDAVVGRSKMRRCTAYERSRASLLTSMLCDTGLAPLPAPQCVI